MSSAMSLMAGVLTQPPPAVATRLPLQPRGDGTVTDDLIGVLQAKGRVSTRQLADAVGLDTRQVWGLLKGRRENGQVTYSGGWWHLTQGWGDSSIEQIEWFPVSRKPDSDITVLCWDGEGFFTGYWDDGLGGWIGCESGGSVLGVTHWAQPEGPAK